MDPSFRIRGHELRSDSFSAQTQTGLETKKRGNRRARESRSWDDTFYPEAVQRLCAAALGASEVKGIQSIMCDFGFAVKPVLIVDANITEHILHRHGIGKMKHIDVAQLWSQDEVKSNRLKVKSEDNLAVIGTTALSNKSIRKHVTSMEYIDAQENLKSGDAMGLWVGKSEQADHSSPAQQKTLLESTGGHAEQQQQQQRQREQPSLAERQLEAICFRHLWTVPQKRIVVDSCSSSFVDFLANWFVASSKFWVDDGIVTLLHTRFLCHRAVVCTRSLFHRIRVGSRLPQNRVAVATLS